eukprot:981378-Pyramimonas_sp.AAC.1
MCFFTLAPSPGEQVHWRQCNVAGVSRLNRCEKKKEYDVIQWLLPPLFRYLRASADIPPGFAKKTSNMLTDLFAGGSG